MPDQLSASRLELARRAAERGDWRRARSWATRALEADGGSAAAMITRAAAAACARDWRPALRDLGRLGRLPARGLLDYGELATPCPRRHPAMMRAADSVVRRAPRLAWGRMLRSFALRGLGRFEEAVSEARRAARLAPADAALRAVLSRVRFVREFPPQALADLRSAAGLEPSCGWISAWLGEALRLRGRPAEALRRLDRAVALDPSYRLAWAWRGILLARRGEGARALQDLDRALDGREAFRDPGLAGAFEARMGLRREAGDVAGALEDLNRAHALNTRYVWVHNPSGDPQAFARAESSLRGLLARRPGHAWARAWLGWTLARAGRPAEALAELRRCPGLSAARAWPLVWRGQARSALGDLARALRDLERAVRLEAGYAPGWAWLGRVRLEAGTPSPRRALRELGRALELDPSLAWAWAWRGSALARLGRLREAAGDADRALALDPSNRIAGIVRAGIVDREAEA